MRFCDTAAYLTTHVVVNAAYYYRRAAVAWSVRPRGLLLQRLWWNNRVALPCI